MEYDYSQFIFHGHDNQTSTEFSPFAPSKMFIKSALIPNSMFTVIAPTTPGWFSNSQFYIDEGAGPTLVSVAEGYYGTMGDFCDAVRVALNTASTVPQIFTVSYSDDNHRITITAAAVPFELLFSVNNEITEMLGFQKVDTGFAIAHTGSYFAQLVPFCSIALHIDELSGAEKARMIGNIDGIGRMHAVFPLVGSSTGYSRFYVNNMYRIGITINGRSIVQMTPRLFVIDSNNVYKQISLNNVPFEFQIDYR